MPDRDWTVCPRCAVGCHLAPGEGERARGLAGPANPEGRLCRMGITAFEKTNGRERLKRPLVRRDGDLEPASWRTALDVAAERFAAVRERHGPDGLAFLGAPHSTNEANYRLQKLARSLGTNNVDNRARHCHDGMARTLWERLGWPATTNSLADLPDADVILVVGANPARRQPVAFNAFVRPPVAAGTTLVHVDPVGNATTRLADVHLAPRPGTDALVLDCLSRAVLGRDGVDREFVDDRTTGFGAFRDSLSALDTAKLAATAGVDAGRLERAADLLSGTDRTAAIVGTGIEGGVVSAPDALLNLLLLAGSVGRRGTGVHLFRGLTNEQGAVDAGCAPDRLPGHRPVTDAAARARVADVWGVEPPETPGRPAPELLEQFGESVRGALVVGENPAVSKRERAWLARRLDALETLVVVDVARSETTAHADVVLPATAGVETAGTVTNLDRQVQRCTPVADSPGDARADVEILGALGRRLLGTGLFDASTQTVFDELASVSPAYAGLEFDALEGSRRWPAGQAVLYRDTFETVDGRAPFTPVESVPGVADHEGAAALTLVVVGRAADDRGSDRSLHLHPDDAAVRNIENGDAVSISTDERTVRATATVEAGVRPGTVRLHAAVADPFVRAGAETVAVERADAE